MMEVNSNKSKRKVKGSINSKGPHLTSLEYQQFVNNAIQQGQGQAKGLGIGILQQLQQGMNVRQQQNISGGGDLGSLFKGLGLNQGQGQMSFSSAVKKGQGPGKGQGQGQPRQKKQETHEEMTKRLNKEALLREDPAFGSLIGSASQVAVYNYDEDTRDWVDTKTAGPLFLYRRSASPEYGLVVLNRKDMKNLAIFFGKQSQVIPNQPYLLFRTPSEGIKCIWFYKDSEFHETIALFHKLGVQFDHSDEESSSSSASGTMDSSRVNGNCLFDMLKQSQAMIGGSAAMPSKGGVLTAEQLEQQMLSDGNPTDQLVPRTSNSRNAALTGFGLMQQLSNSSSKTGVDSVSVASRLQVMRTVEQLEKDMKPEDAVKQEMSNELLATLGIKPMKDNIPDSNSEPNSPDSPFLTPTSGSCSGSERSRKFTIDDLDGKLYEETDEDMVREVVENLEDLTQLVLIPQNVLGRAEPQLMWRKRSNLNTRPKLATPVGQVSPTVNGNGTGAHLSDFNHQQPNKTTNHLTAPAILPLTQNQLLQAITYLFQTDPSFIVRIHEAYVKSLQQCWASNYH